MRGSGGPESSMNISSTLINFDPLVKLKFQPLCHDSLSIFERCSIKMDNHNIELLYSILCLLHLTSKFHLKMSEDSKCSEVVPMEITYGKDHAPNIKPQVNVFTPSPCRYSFHSWAWQSLVCQLCLRTASASFGGSSTPICIPSFHLCSWASV